MVAEAPKLAHQQQWLRKPAHGASGSFSLALKAIPTLCLTVAPGCPNPSARCLSVPRCAASAERSGMPGRAENGTTLIACIYYVSCVYCIVIIIVAVL